jgi:hypothetical protein
MGRGQGVRGEEEMNYSRERGLDLSNPNKHRPYSVMTFSTLVVCRRMSSCAATAGI